MAQKAELAWSWGEGGEKGELGGNKRKAEVGSTHELVIRCLQKMEWVVQVVDWPDLANENTRHPVKFKFQTNSKLSHVIFGTRIYYNKIIPCLSDIQI